MYKIATYGSLKIGFHNHRWLENSTYLGESTIKGIMQILPGLYPNLFLAEEIKTTEKETEHTIEIYEITEERFTHIHNIELDSGYYSKLIQTPFGKATIWITKPQYFNTSLPIDKEYTLSIYNKIKQNA